jgi:chlorobactene glucosyltransferase
MRDKSWFNIISAFSIGMSLVGITALRNGMNGAGKLKTIRQGSSLSKEQVCVIIPAKDEEDVIADCVSAVAQQSYNNIEIIVANDSSADNTAQILRDLQTAKHIRELKVIEVEPPESGWTGKTNALWQAYTKSSSTADWILFLDADTILSRSTIEAAIDYAKDNKLDLLSLAGSAKWQSIWTPLMIAEVSKFYAIAHSNPLKPPKKNSVEAASAIGTFILVERAAYDTVGGHVAVKNSIIEDIELAKAFRRYGFTTEQINAPDYLQTLWYENFAELWEGVSKNMFVVADRKWDRIAFLLIIEWIYGLLPFFVLLKQLGKKGTNSKLALSKLLNYLSVVLIIIFHNQINKSLKIPAIYSFFYPAAAVISSVITLYSALKIQFGKKVNWKGRNITVS